jgi:gamma-glutamylcyclotransferase (GGCT)/AIG2-like uncharacterized protein YtfP
MVHHVFVYGTLMRGECRQRCWPHEPVRVDQAAIRAALYDLGPYPAIGPGDEPVPGELWEIAPEDLEETLRVLDRVEGYGELGQDLYVRRLVTCETSDGRRVPAWTYYFGDESRLAAAPRIPSWKQRR